VFNLLVIDRTNEYASVNVPIDSLRESYYAGAKLYGRSPIWVTRDNLIVYKKAARKHEIEREHVLDDVNAFLESRDSHSKLRSETKSHFRESEFTFGLDSYSKAKEGLEKLLAGVCVFDYKFVHLLAEHAKHLSESVLFFSLAGDSTREKFGRAAAKLEVARLAFLRAVLVQTNYTNIYAKLENESVLHKVIRLLDDARYIYLDVGKLG
jgi:hypothetical protein